MPKLRNPKHEAFARMCARGFSLADAFMFAGYRPDRGHASRLRARPDVQARIDDYAREFVSQRPAGPQAVIASLLALAERSAHLDTPAGFKEARVALIEARRVDSEQGLDEEKEGRRLEEERERTALAVKEALRDAENRVRG